MTPDEHFFIEVFRRTHNRYPKGKEFDEWYKRFMQYWTIKDIAITDLLNSRLLLEKAGLGGYAREVYWTSIALLMKKHDEENRDE